MAKPTTFSEKLKKSKSKAGSLDFNFGYNALAKAARKSGSKRKGGNGGGS